MTKSDLGKLFAKDTGLSLEKGINAAKNNTSRFKQWLARHPEYVPDGNGTGNRGLELIDPGDNINEILEANWNAITEIHTQISLAIQSDPKELKNLTGGLKDLQQAYVQMSEIKKANEDRARSVIKRDYVETIVGETLPKLRTALDELRTNIKQLLPPEVRATFEEAFRSSMVPYTEAVQDAIDNLNEYLE